MNKTMNTFSSNKNKKKTFKLETDCTSFAKECLRFYNIRKHTSSSFKRGIMLGEQHIKESKQILFILHLFYLKICRI